MVQVKVQPQVWETVQGQNVNPINEKIVSTRGGPPNVISSVELPSQAMTREKKEDNPSLGKPEEMSLKRKSHWFVWFVVALVLIAAGVAAYYLIFKK